MIIPQPQHISREDLVERLQHEVASLTGADLAWWTAHRVSPFPARHGETAHFIVAASGQSVIFFDRTPASGLGSKLVFASFIWFNAKRRGA
jgi:hypothetical protein